MTPTVRVGIVKILATKKMAPRLTAYVLTFAILALTGCAEYKQAKNDRAAEQMGKACQTKYPAIKGSFVLRVTCLNDALSKKFEGNSDIDLLNLLNAKRVIIATSADNGIIDKSTFDLQMAQAQSDIFSQYDSRLNARSSSNAAAIGSASSFYPVNQPYMLPMPQQPIRTYCYRIGNSTNCTTQ